MSDFRASEDYKSFVLCRGDREAFKKALDTYAAKDTARSLKAKLAIEALAHNEKCLKIAEKIDLRISQNSLKTTFEGLLSAYKDRIGYEKELLQAILTNNLSNQAKTASILLETQVNQEDDRFEKVESLTNTPFTISSALNAVLLVALIFLAWRGYVNKRQNQGVTAMTKSTFKGLMQGVAESVRSLKGRKKDV